jgi:hypothetical protein
MTAVRADSGQGEHSRHNEAKYRRPREADPGSDGDHKTGSFAGEEKGGGR